MTNKKNFLLLFSFVLFVFFFFFKSFSFKIIALFTRAPIRRVREMLHSHSLRFDASAHDTTTLGHLCFVFLFFSHGIARANSATEGRVKRVKRERERASSYHVCVYNTLTRKKKIKKKKKKKR
jgi:hypothetical protein